MGKHCPYLHQRGDRYYFFWKRDGKRVEESLRTTDLQVAKERYKKRLIEIESGCSPNDRSGWTLQQAADDWLKQHRCRKKNFPIANSLASLVKPKLVGTV